MGRLLRSLHVQLFLWAVTPVTFVIIAISFTGVYAHQQEMRDFVVSRDVALARLTAQIAQDGLAHGVVAGDGSDLATWMALDASDLQGAIIVLDEDGRVLAHTSPGQIGADLSRAPGVPDALALRQGSAIVDDVEGPLLTTFEPIAGTGWTVLIQEHVDELIGPLLRFPSLIPAIAAGAAILSLLILGFGWLTIVRPLQRLARSAEQVSWGGYSALSGPPQGVQEVRDLHQAIVEMVERIRGNEAGMRDYLGAVTRGQEAERARLARELHDGPVQELIALGQRAEMADRLVEREQKAGAQAVLRELRQTGHETVGELRRLIGALSPAYLEDLGFVPALEMLIRQASARTQAEIHLDTGDHIVRLSPDVELAAYRIAQEALNNAVQHAQAQHITVRVQCREDGLILSVDDDGVGFDLPRRPDLLTRSGRFGLISMRERATLLGGRLQIQSAPGQGTHVTAHLPECSIVR